MVRKWWNTFNRIHQTCNLTIHLLPGHWMGCAIKLNLLELITRYVFWFSWCHCYMKYHYNDIIMSMMASQITSPMIVYSTVYSGANKKNIKAPHYWPFVWGIHWWPVNSPHKWPVKRKFFPFDDVTMQSKYPANSSPFVGMELQYHGHTL